VQPTAKSVLLDLLSTIKGGALPVRALVAAGELFDIRENALRVALARLRAAGLVRSDAPGLYRLGDRAEAVNRLATSWRAAERGVRSWSGDWVAVASGGLTRTRQLAGVRALAFLGCRELRPGLAVRPDNLVGGVDAARQHLRELGLDAGADVFGLHDLAADTARRAAALWDTAALRLGYRRTIADLERSELRLATLPRERAMAESFLLGGRAIRQIVFDPRLPDALVPAAERRALIDALLRYDRLGRATWSSFMREMGGTLGSTPAHVRFGAGDTPGSQQLTGVSGA